MKDQISELRLQETHPQCRLVFKSFIEQCEDDFNVVLRITQAFRGIEEQNRLYEQGRSLPGKIVTNAKGGSSFHNYGLAIDLAVLKNERIDWSYPLCNFRPLAKQHGIEWGGDWKSLKDKPHFQMTFGNDWQVLLEKYNNQEFIPGTKFLILF